PDFGNNRVRAVSPFLPGLAAGDYLVPSEDGAEIYVFGGGRHVQTLDGLTAAVQYSLVYDSAGHLESVTDGDGNATTIEHDGSGHPTAIVGPYGHRTRLSTDSNGYLQSIVNPASETVELTTSADGLLGGMVDPRGGRHAFDYD